jgi:hypothetical protein
MSRGFETETELTVHALELRMPMPTAVLSVGLVVLEWLSIFAGIILDVVTKARQELKFLAYLSIASPRIGSGKGRG